MATVALLCFYCRKRPARPRLTTCSVECWRRLEKADRALARLDRKAPRENLGGVGGRDY